MNLEESFEICIFKSYWHQHTKQKDQISTLVDFSQKVLQSLLVFYYLYEMYETMK